MGEKLHKEHSWFCKYQILQNYIQPAVPEQQSSYGTATETALGGKNPEDLDLTLISDLISPWLCFLIWTLGVKNPNFKESLQG